MSDAFWKAMEKLAARQGLYPDLPLTQMPIDPQSRQPLQVPPTISDNAQLAAAWARHATDAARIAALESEVAHFTQSGIVEVAVRNQSVAEYMVHWEQRAEKAEAEAARLQSLLDAAAAEWNPRYDAAVERAEKAETEMDRLREALKPLAALPILDETADDVPVLGLDGRYITHGDVRAARAALGVKP